MRHYEIVFIVHPDQSEQVPAMVERYRRSLPRMVDKSTVLKTGVVVSSLIRSRSCTRRTMF